MYSFNSNFPPKSPLKSNSYPDGNQRDEEFELSADEINHLNCPKEEEKENFFFDYSSLNFENFNKNLIHKVEPFESSALIKIKKEEEETPALLTTCAKVGKIFDVRIENQKIKVDVDATAKKIERVIYCWFNHDKKRALIGKTEATFQSRISSYQSAVNSSSKDDAPKSRKKTAFQKDLLKDRFSVAILEILDHSDNSSEREKYWIAEAKKSLSVYNENAGGGGGWSRKNEKSRSYALPLKYQSPKKYYPFERSKNGKIRVVRPPSSDLEEQEGFPSKAYIIKQTYEKGNVLLTKRYVGATSRDIAVRGQEHSSKGTLSELIKKNPDSFKIGAVTLIDGSKVAESERVNYTFYDKIGQVENDLIKKASKVGEGVFNKKGGGGGGIGFNSTIFA